MTTKDSTLFLEVDLQCEKCYKKIQKVLCKLQSKENIKKIDYENTKNKVTVVGAFDPKKLSKILRCKACDVIKDITIKPPEDPKKTEENKSDEKKKPDKKPEDNKKKPEDDKKKEKPTEEKKPEAKAAPAAPSTTVNLKFTNICNICYPWPCYDPTHWGGMHHQQPQWPPCGWMAPAPAPAAPAPPVHNHPHPQPRCGGGGPQKWSQFGQCGGPPFCGGCAGCHGGGGGGRNCWAPPPPPPLQPMCCPGPSMCRGCNGCKLVRETKFSYEEYPNGACAIM